MTHPPAPDQDPDPAIDGDAGDDEAPRPASGPDDAAPAPAADDPQARPRVTLRPAADRRARFGHPWIFSNEVVMDPAARALPAGSLVTVLTAEGRQLAAGLFNPHSLIALRLLTLEAGSHIHAAFLRRRLEAALALRDRLYPEPYYRLVHAEADGLPGLVVDRYGDVLAVQLNSAGMDRLGPLVLDALDALLRPRAVVLRNDSPARAAEGLERRVRVARGALDGPVALVENGARFVADLEGGQKTGWFFDQRDNRAFVARLARGARVLDLYSYAGGFAVQAALAGAAAVVAVDRAEGALAQAGEAARLNGVADRVDLRRAEVFGELERLAAEGTRFDLVIADPPAFVKSRKDLKAGARGYRKLARMSAGRVAPGGILFLASCSHNVDPALFLEETRRGIADAGRSARVLRAAGAAPDHPVHPWLPESAYLKALVYALD